MFSNPFAFFFGDVLFNGFVQFRVLPLEAFIWKFGF